MSSFNKIEKIKYTKNQTDAVSLAEYIVFEDEQIQEKYVVLKLCNNLNQRLYDIKLEISQYDCNNELLEKSNISYSAKVEEHDTFVPKAKLKVNYACKSISCRLIYARFERSRFENGEFSEIAHRFEPHNATLPPVKQAPIIEVKQPKVGKRKFSYRNTLHKNVARFPKFVNGLICFICVAFFIGSVIGFRLTTNKIAVGDIIYRPLNEESISICKYDNKESEVYLPVIYDDKEVVIIEGYAFMNHGLNSIVMDNEYISIRTEAFVNCNNLETITVTNNGQVYPEAFVHCNNIKNVNMENVWLSAENFDDVYHLDTLNIAGAKVGSLAEVFSIEKNETLSIDVLRIYEMSELKEGYLDNLKVSVLYVNRNCRVDESLYEKTTILTF